MPLFKCSASKAKPKNGIRYITDPKKAAFVSAKNLFEDEDYAKQFEETAKRFGKGEKFDERKYYHFKLSCARKDNVTPEKAHAYAEEAIIKSAIRQANTRIFKLSAPLLFACLREYQRKMRTRTGNLEHVHARNQIQFLPY